MNPPADSGADAKLTSLDAIARSFVEARLAGRSLAAFPGEPPSTLAEAYRIQEAAIDRWPDRIAGWKIGRIPDELQAALGSHRIAGPIFAPQVRQADGAVEFPVFVGGFAAVEAEFIFRLAEDAPADKMAWTLDEAARLAGQLIVGVEPAGSPLASINALGPTAVVSDFGNNAGLILGYTVEDWRGRLASMTCRTFIDGREVGAGGAASIPGGPIESLRFLLELCARRGRPLKAGDLISTGAATGIHDIVVGQTARIVFDGVGEIACRPVPAKERPGA